MKGCPLSWRAWNPKTSLSVPHIAGTILSNLEIFTGQSLNILMQLSILEKRHSPPMWWRQGARNRTGTEFQLTLFFLSCIEKHSEQTGVLLISWKWSWERKSLIAPTDLREAHTRLSRTVLKTQIDSNLYASQAWSNANITTCGAAGFRPHCLHRSSAGFSLVMKQLPDFSRESGVLTHCQVWHAQDKNVQEVQESGFIFKLIFI